jgi:hypothetical protein
MMMEGPRRGQLHLDTATKEEEGVMLARGWTATHLDNRETRAEAIRGETKTTLVEAWGTRTAEVLKELKVLPSQDTNLLEASKVLLMMLEVISSHNRAADNTCLEPDQIPTQEDRTTATRVARWPNANSHLSLLTITTGTGSQCIINLLHKVTHEMTGTRIMTQTMDPGYMSRWHTAPMKTDRGMELMAPGTPNRHRSHKSS